MGWNGNGCVLCILYVTNRYWKSAMSMQNILINMQDIRAIPQLIERNHKQSIQQIVSNCCSYLGALWIRDLIRSLYGLFLLNRCNFFVRLQCGEFDIILFEALRMNFVCKRFFYVLRSHNEFTEIISFALLMSG